MEILHRDDLPLGGFAGLKEHRLVMDKQAWGERAEPGVWPGLGKFVYLADARFLPKGETKMHGHKEVDVVSVMVAGRIAHEGSLAHGQELTGQMVLVQRAGGEGFSHNEVNPDDHENRMLQLWVMPERPGEPAGYRLYAPRWGEVVRVYGGPADQDETYPARTVVEVALLRRGQGVTLEGDSLAYLVKGRGRANGTAVAEGDLLRGEGLDFEAAEAVQLIAVTLGAR